jgi:hypothetical protein
MDPVGFVSAIDYHWLHLRKTSTLLMSVCVCVCERERERERERVLGPMIFFRPRDRVIFFLRHFIKKMLLLRFHCHTSLDQQKITRCGTARRSHLPYTVRRLHSRHCRHCRQALTLPLLLRAACNGQRVASSGQQAAGGARAAGRAGSNPAHASDNGQAITVEHW